MSSQANEQVVLRLFNEAWSQGKYDVLDEMVASDSPPAHGVGPEGPETWKESIQEFRDTFPDLTFTVDDLISDGDKVVIRWTANGTDKGGFMGMPATGRSASATGITIYRFVDGKLFEHWDEFSMAQLLEQLDVSQEEEQEEVAAS